MYIICKPDSVEESVHKNIQVRLQRIGIIVYTDKVEGYRPDRVKSVVLCGLTAKLCIFFTSLVVQKIVFIETSKYVYRALESPCTQAKLRVTD